MGKTLLAFAIGVVATTATLSGWLVWHNPIAWTFASVAELVLAVAFVAVLTNGAFVAALLLAWPVVRRLLPHDLRHAWGAFLAGGLPALHLAWIFLNRLPLPQQLFFPPLYVTPAGLLQAGLIAVVCGLVVWAALVGLGRHRTGAAVLALALAVGIASICLVWNASEEGWQRPVALEEVARVAAEQAPKWAAVPAGESGPVIVLGIDGLSWAAALPLMAEGRLPGFSALVGRGAIGYLDNGDDSYSPRIWNEIFSGRPADEHGVHGFIKLVLPRTGTTVPDFVSQVPAIDTFYGIKQLFRRARNLGPDLWRLVETQLSDVRVQRIWDVASDQGRSVVVANPLNIRPVYPVGGAMVAFQERADEGTFYPAELASRWAVPDVPGIKRRSVAEWKQVVDAEAAFTLELFEEHQIDLGIYFTNVIDALGHVHWAFASEGRRLVWDRPADLDDEAWHALVVENADRPVFAGYGIVDAALVRIQRAHPHARFVLVSDHGWTFSGFKHYGSQDGVIVLSGPGVRPGVLSDKPHIRDIAPTVLSLLGVPISRELQGRVIAEALENPPAVAYVDAYGPPPFGAGDSTQMSEELLDQLEAMGYVR